MQAPTQINLYLNSIENHSGVLISEKKMSQFGTIVIMRTKKNMTNIATPLSMYILESFCFNVSKTHLMFMNGVEPSEVNLNKAIYGKTPAVLKFKTNN
jgi:hypothetical protein